MFVPASTSAVVAGPGHSALETAITNLERELANPEGAKVLELRRLDEIIQKELAHSSVRLTAQQQGTLQIAKRILSIQTMADKTRATTPSMQSVKVEQTSTLKEAVKQIDPAGKFHGLAHKINEMNLSIQPPKEVDRESDSKEAAVEQMDRATAHAKLYEIKSKSSALQEYQNNGKTFYAIKIYTEVEGLPVIKDFEVERNTNGIILKDTEEKIGRRPMELFFASKKDLEDILKEISDFDLMKKMFVLNVTDIKTEEIGQLLGQLKEIYQFFLSNSRVICLLWCNAKERAQIDQFCKKLRQLDSLKAPQEVQEMITHRGALIRCLLLSQHTIDRMEDLSIQKLNTNIPYSHRLDDKKAAIQNQNPFVYLHLDAVPIAAKEFKHTSNGSISKLVTQKYVFPIMDAFAGIAKIHANEAVFLLRKSSMLEPDDINKESLILNICVPNLGLKEIVIHCDKTRDENGNVVRETWSFHHVKLPEVDAEGKPKPFPSNSTLQNLLYAYFKFKGRIHHGIPQLDPEAIKQYLQGDKKALTGYERDLSSTSYVPVSH